MPRHDGPRGVFHGDPSPTHQAYTRHLESQGAPPPGASLPAMWKQLARRVACPSCEAQADYPCISAAVDTPGMELRGYHNERMSLAKKTFGRKR